MWGWSAITLSQLHNTCLDNFSRSAIIEFTLAKLFCSLAMLWHRDQNMDGVVTADRASGSRRRDPAETRWYDYSTPTVPLTSSMPAPVDGGFRGDRDRDQASRAERAERLAAQLEVLCDEGDAALSEAVAARDEQQIAWLILCDRGWPRTSKVLRTDVSLTHGWLDTWSDHVALPVRISTARDMVKLRQVRRRLERCELSLRSDLPAELWRIVDPLDDTGRATLAYVLHALLAWVDACTRCDISTSAKERLAGRFSLFAPHIRALSLDPPLAPLDVSSWRALAAAARSCAAEARETHAA